MSDSSPQLHGPGGLLNTPGLGARRKGRKWGMRLKDKQIIGNLYRSDTGKFTAGGQPSDAPPRFGKAPKKPKKGRASRKPRATDAQRQEARSAKRQANSDAVAKRMAESDTGLSPSGSAALTAFAQGTQPDPQVGSQLAQMGLAEQATDGSYRMTETGRAVAGAMAAGDYQRAIDGISRATDQAGKRTQRATEHTARQQATVAKRAATEATRAARREQVAQRRAEAAAKKPAKGGGAKKPDEAAAKPAAKKPAPKRSARMPSGGGSSSSAVAKPAPPAAAPKPTTADNRGAVRQAMAEADQGLAPGGFDNLMALGDGKEPDSTGATGLISMGMAERGSDGTLRLTSGGRQAIAAADRGDAKAAIDAISKASEPKKTKSFIVYKDHAGTHRWLARTTTSYRDRDNEIISSDALDTDSQRMTATKSFGPLRYWHVGQPDPFDVANPAGPGLDIGDCDYSALIGRTRIEGGTFRDSAIAQKVAVRADQYELSPGFFHPLDQPDTSGVFNAIRTFERSIVPVAYGRASNLFTGLAVKESRMELDEMERRFKAAITDLGLDAAQASALGQQLVQTEKDATAQGIAFKSDEVPEYPDMEINGVVYKAFPPKAPADDELPIEEVKADAPPMVDETVVDEQPPADEMAGDYIGDMSWDEFAAKLTELLAPVLKMQDMHKGMTDALGEMKTMYGGQVTKDAGTQAEIASLKARLAEIEGDQPNTILPDDVAEALKSAGPAQPAEPEKTKIVSTPDRPWAGWGASTFPELYQNGEST